MTKLSLVTITKIDFLYNQTRQKWTSQDRPYLFVKAVVTSLKPWTFIQLRDQKGTFFARYRNNFVITMIVLPDSKCWKKNNAEWIQRQGFKQLVPALRHRIKLKFLLWVTFKVETTNLVDIVGLNMQHTHTQQMQKWGPSNRNIMRLMFPPPLKSLSLFLPNGK